MAETIKSLRVLVRKHIRALPSVIAVPPVHTGVRDEGQGRFELLIPRDLFFIHSHAPPRQLMIGEIGQPVEAVRRIVPIVVRFEALDPCVANLDRLVPNLTLLINWQCLKSKPRMILIVHRCLEVLSLSLSVNMLCPFNFSSS